MAFEKEDVQVIGAFLDEVTAALSVQTQRLNAAVRTGLGAEVDALSDVLGRAQAAFGKIDAVDITFDGAHTRWLRLYECEREHGCLTDYKGTGGVARNILPIADAYREAAAGWRQLKGSRSDAAMHAQRGVEAASQLVTQDEFDEARRLIGDVRRHAQIVAAADPTFILRGLVATLGRPLLGGLSAVDRVSKEQLKVLHEVANELATEREQVRDMLLQWSRTGRDLPPPTQGSEVDQRLEFERRALENLAKYFDSILARRRGHIEGVKRQFERISANVDSSDSSDGMIGSVPVLATAINDARSELVLLQVVDRVGVERRIEELNDNRSYLNRQWKSRDRQYPTVEEFIPTPLHIGILARAYLGIVPLLIQVLLDFGYTIAVVLGVSKIHDMQHRHRWQ